MEFTWFIYTILIMMVAIAAGASSLSVWVLTNRRDCLVAAFAFAVYALETAGVLFDEYMRIKPVMEELFTGGLTHPAINIILSICLVTSVWAWVAMRVHAEVDAAKVCVFVLAYGLAAVLLAPVGESAGIAKTLAFWALRDALIIGALVFAWWWRTYRASESDRVSIDRASGFWRVALVLACMVLVEDIIVILFIRTDEHTGWMQEFFWHLTERNLSDNVLMIACAIRMILYNREIMSIFSQHPMEIAGSGEMGRPATAHRDYESRLLRFADDHEMSKREREVMGLAIEGRSTQEIASSLYISTGTVKAHMHRIYKKAGVAGRQELIRAFWKY